MASSQGDVPHSFVKIPFWKSVVSFQPVEKWRLRLPMRGWDANVASVLAVAELTVETIGVERQSSAPVTSCQIFSADSSICSIRDECGRRSHVPVWGSLNPGSSPLPSCMRERSTVSG